MDNNSIDIRASWGDFVVLIYDIDEWEAPALWFLDLEHIFCKTIVDGREKTVSLQEYIQSIVCEHCETLYREVLESI